MHRIETVTLKLLAGTFRMTTITRQFDRIFRRLAICGTILLARRGHAQTTIHRTLFSLSCHGQNLRKPTLPGIVLSLGCRWVDAVCLRLSPTGCFPASVQRASNWSQSISPHSTYGRSPACAQNPPSGEPRSAFARASRSSRSGNAGPQTPRSAEDA